MGHAHHFLSRLDRVSQDHVELALSLYNDPEILRFILSHARIPDSVERVAISLAHPVDGPFLVVTRAGNFVTCLGDGMRVSIPIVTRAGLDAAMAQVSWLRDRSEAAKRLCPDERASVKLLKRIFEAGENLSREEFLALSAMQPMMWGQFFKWIQSSATQLYDARNTFVECDEHVIERSGLYAAWWDTNWALKHLFLLMGIDSPSARLASLPVETLASIRHSFTHHATLYGLFPQLAAGSWCTARFTDAFMPICEHRYRAATSRADIVESAVDLFAIAGRTGSRYDAVRRILSPGASPAANDSPASAAHESKRAIAALYDHTLGERDTRRDVDAAIAGAKLFIERRPAAAQWNGWKTLNDVPADLARVTLVNDLRGALGEGADLAETLRHIPAIARMRADQFYLPAELLQKVREPGSVMRTKALIAQFSPKPTADAKKLVRAVGRNEACPCESGRKYKKCCAMPAPRESSPQLVVPSLATALKRNAA